MSIDKQNKKKAIYLLFTFLSRCVIKQHCQVLDEGSDLSKASNLRNIQKTAYAYILHALSGTRTDSPLVQAVLDRAHDS
jgi:hypothetical protein